MKRTIAILMTVCALCFIQAHAFGNEVIENFDDETPIFITIGQSNADGSAFANPSEDNRLGAWYDNPTTNPKLMKIWYRSCYIVNQANGARWVTDGTTIDISPGWLDLYYKNDNLNGKTAMNMIHGYGTWSHDAAGRRGMEGELGIHYQSNYPQKELYIIKLGCSGSKIETWADLTDNHNWDYFYDNVYKPAISNLLKQGKKPRLSGIWWMQGEANNSDTKAYYQRHITTLIQKCREKLGFEKAHFYIGQIVKPGESTTNSHASVSFGQGVRDAQNAITNLSNEAYIPYTSIIDGSDCAFDSDNLHWGHKGINSIGKKIATEIINSGIENWASYSTPGNWENLDQILGENRIITFTPIIGEPKSITYEYDIDGVWTTICPILIGRYKVRAKLDYGTWKDIKTAYLQINDKSEITEAVYVVSGGTGNGNSWTNAMGDISAAIRIANEALPKKKVLVATGEYQLASTLILPSGVSLIGGYGSDVTSEAQGEITHLKKISGTGEVVKLSEGTSTSFAKISNVTISGATNGRGVTAFDYSVVDCCVIENNKAYGTIYGNHDGAGISLKNKTSLSNTIIRNNSTSYIGGGIAVDGNDVHITNCLITGNSSSNTFASAGVGGIIHWNGKNGTKITNCTVVNNNGVNKGGYWGAGSNSSAIISNTIFWGNKINSNLSPNNEYIANENHAFKSCASTQPGIGFMQLNSNNIKNDGPNFTDPTNEDYTLTAESPCVDAGDNSFYIGDFSDIDLSGNPRIANGIIDCGAYECNSPVGIKHTIDNNFDIIFYPNPIESDLFYQNKSDKDIAIKLNDLQGNLIFIKSIQARSIGVIPMKMLTSGIYIINYQGSLRNISHKVIKK